MPEGALNRTADAIHCLVKSVLDAPAGDGPVVTVSWAQSRDGAIAPAGGKRTTLSSPESMTLTHRLRSLHGGILVGIGTVLADDPLLTVRLVEGPSPQPIVLDSALRMPGSARLLQRADHAPWIFHAAGASASRARELAGRGARLFALSATEGGLPLDEVLRILGTHGIGSLMVEGGARVLRSFISCRLAHQAVVTVSPLRMEGLHIFDQGEGLPELAEKSEKECGPDTVIWGRFLKPKDGSAGLSELG